MTQKPSNLKILAYEDTPLGPLCLRRRELKSEPGKVITEITLNHEFLMSSLNTDSERALTRVALEKHEGSDLRVLVGGLGLGYTAYEALCSKQVRAVEVIELLPQVISWLDQDLMPLSKELKEATHLKVSEGDVYEKLLSPPEDLHDLILIDVDHSPEERLHEASGRFYTREGLAHAKKHLASGGILAVWSYAENSPFAEALREVFQEVTLVPISHTNTLTQQDFTDWLFFARDPA